jgi:hypothetical protein
MQSKRSNASREPALALARRRAAREAVMRVTQELLQSHGPSHKDDLPNDEHVVEYAPAQDANQSITEQKTKLLQAIQPVLEVVADSTQQHNDPGNVQL